MFTRRISCHMQSFSGEGGQDDHAKRLQQFLHHKRAVSKYNRLIKEFPYKKHITPIDVERVMRNKWGKTLHVDIEERVEGLSVVVSGIQVDPTTYVEVCELLNEKQVGMNFLELLSMHSRHTQPWAFIDILLEDVVKGPRACEWNIDESM